RRLGRPGQRGRRRGGAADVAPVAADQRDPPRRGAPEPDRRAGAGECARGRAGPVQRAAHPGRGVSSRMTNAQDLTHLTAAQMADGLAAGDFTSVELTQAHLDRISRLNPVLNAFLQVDIDGALATAADTDSRRAAGEELPRLAGVPIAVKDIACTQGIPTTAGSRTLEGWIPPYDATIVTRLKEDRKSTRLNSSHVKISYAVFCLKTKTK